MASTSDTTTDALLALARSCGIHPVYHDIRGVERHASPDALVAALRAFGVPIDRPAQAAAAFRAREQDHWRQVVDPVTVAWDGAPPATILRMPDSRASSIADCHLDLEDGSDREWLVRIGDLPVVEAETVRRTAYAARRLTFPEHLPLGVHRLRVTAGATTGECVVIAAPARGGSSRSNEPTRNWGVVLPLYAIPNRSWGVGDVGDLRELATWAASAGAEVVATLPLLASFLDEPCEPSPYAPVSRRFWNELYVDVARIPDLRWSPRAAALLESSGLRTEIAALRAADRVDYRRTMAAKRRVLETLVAGLADGPGAREAAFREFLIEHPEVTEYARFRAAGERFGTNWRTWPSRLRRGTIGFTDIDPQAEAYHRYCQWVAHEQMAALAHTMRDRGQVLALDLPLGSHPDGYDVWHDQDTFVSGVCAGAPPDGFFAAGQSWGFPPPHPEAIRRDGHRLWRHSLAHHLRHSGLLRVDHVMSLHRVFWVVEGFEARDGVYVDSPADELYATLCLEAHRYGADIVGENLGTVPVEVNDAMERHAVRGMHVAQFGIDPAAEAPVERPAPNTVASFGTHDLPTFAGWWQARDLDEQQSSGQLAPEDDAVLRAGRERARAALWRAAGQEGEPPDTAPRAALQALLERLARSDASTVLVNLEDLWLEHTPQNVPGTVSADNWTHKAAVGFRELAADPALTAPLEPLRELRPWLAATNGAVSHPAGETVSGVSLLTPGDLHLFNEGRHFQLHHCLGAHPLVADGVAGTYFAVWAPNADDVAVIGDFNEWDADRHPLRPVERSGIWEGFVPGVRRGARYKYRVQSRHGGYGVDKADPFAFFAEQPPRTASIVWDLGYEWRDAVWMATRHDRQGRDKPLSVYEVHLGSWMRGDDNRMLTYRELAPRLADYALEQGFTHVELLPVMEHPFYGSWGYQTTGYFAATSRYGTPHDLMALVDHLHESGVGVILDWVPSHFPDDEHGLAFFDGTHLYEHADPRQRVHPDWQSYIFNYGRNEVRSFLVSNALFWLEHYHADGLRTDAVASMLYLDYSRRAGEWTPNAYGGNENLEALEFLRVCNSEVHDRFPEVLTYAEESTAWPGVTRSAMVGGLGFAYKWDMGWMHDSLAYFQREPIHRAYHLDNLTFRMLYAHSEQYVLPLSHDEVVHGKGALAAKMPGDHWQQLANLRLLHGYMHGMPGKKLLFMGGEIGVWNEWHHEQSLDWHLLQWDPHRGVQRWVRRLNELHRSVRSLHERDGEVEGFEWIDCQDRANSVLSFVRWGREGAEPVLVVANFTSVPRHPYRIGAPGPGVWEVIANSDDPEYGGSGYPVPSRVEATEPGMHGRPFAVELALPPLGLLFLRREC